MATTTNTRPGLVNRCKRGDVIAWAQRHDYTSADNRVAPPVTIWHVGIVRSVTREGLAKTAEDGLGVATVSHDIESRSVKREMIDLDKARAWLASNANYPRAGGTPLRSLGEVRAVVRTWFRD